MGRHEVDVKKTGRVTESLTIIKTLFVTFLWVMLRVWSRVDLRVYL